jgi:uncharacterized protein
MLQVTFPEIAHALAAASSSIPPAESHGCLCGALCVSAAYSLNDWLAELIPDSDEQQAVAHESLALLFTDTVNALRGDQMEFEPLLPEDQESLERRANALSEWCQGFLYGFGSVRSTRGAELPANVEEVLRDLTHIGQAAVDPGESGEDEERAYYEIVEYVRAGVQLVHDELVEARVLAATPPPAPDDDLPH